MTIAESESRVLVLKSDASDYFVVPRDALERGRVPADKKAEVERLIAQSAGAPAAAGDDTQGHFWPIVWAAEIAVGVAVIIGWSGPDVPTGPSTGGGGASPGGGAPSRGLNQGGTSGSRPL